MVDAETVLRKLFKKILDEPYNNGDVKLTKLESGGANYSALLFSAAITYKDEEPLQLFMKISNVNLDVRDVMPVVTLFETEQYFYEYISKVYTKIQDAHNIDPVDRLKFPKYYGGELSEFEETVVLENLTVRGYNTCSRFESIDWEHAANAIDSLAKLHALSFAFAKEQPDNFAKVVKKLEPQPLPKSSHASAKATMSKILATTLGVVKDEHKERISVFLDSLPFEELHLLRMPFGTTVLCHGDYKISNLMFKRQDGKLDNIIIDYQTLQSGCPAFDLIYLEFMGTDEEFRKNYHDKLVNYYFERLSEELAKLGLDVNEVYPRETYDSELQKTIPVALFTAAYLLPFIVVDEHRAPQLGTAQSSKDFILEANDLFAERYSGIVTDCIRWGAI